MSDELIDADGNIKDSHRRAFCHRPRGNTPEYEAYLIAENAFAATVVSFTPVEGWIEHPFGFAVGGGTRRTIWKHPDTDALRHQWLDGLGFPKKFPEGYPKEATSFEPPTSVPAEVVSGLNADPFFKDKGGARSIMLAGQIKEVPSEAQAIDVRTATGHAPKADD